MKAAFARLGYQPGKTWLHRLHPLVKGAWLLAATVYVFAEQAVIPVVGILAFCGLCWLWIAPGQVRGLRLVWLTALLLMGLQWGFVDEGNVFLDLGFVQITDVGFANGIYVGGRFVDVVLLSYLFVLTTDPNALAYALMQVGAPYRFGFALITALRLAPIFEQEGQTVYQAQLARGIAYDAGGLERWFKLARQFVMPLLVSALSKVDALSVSMEGRCFGKYPQRTFLRKVVFTWGDGAAIVLLGLLIGLAVTWR